MDLGVHVDGNIWSQFIQGQQGFKDCSTEPSASTCGAAISVDLLGNGFSDTHPKGDRLGVLHGRATSPRGRRTARRHADYMASAAFASGLWPLAVGGEKDLVALGAEKAFNRDDGAAHGVPRRRYSAAPPEM